MVATNGEREIGRSGSVDRARIRSVAEFGTETKAMKALLTEETSGGECKGDLKPGGALRLRSC